MPFSLDKQVSNLDDDQSRAFKELYYKEEVFWLMRRNGVNPYEPSCYEYLFQGQMRVLQN